MTVRRITVRKYRIVQTNAEKVQGARKLRNKLRRLPEEIRAEVRDVIAAEAEKVLADAKGLVPVETGNLSSAMRVVVEKSGFRAKIGFVGKRAARKGWYARFVEFGTPATQYRRKSKIKKGTGKTARTGPRKPVQAKPFLTPAFKRHLPEIRKAMRAAIPAAFRKASIGG